MAAPEPIEGRRVTIIGMARSGLAAAELVLRRGGTPFVSDGAPAAALAEAIASLESGGIEYEAGGHSPRALDADYLVTSPGVPPRAGVLGDARLAGLPVYSELELASWVCEAPMLAVTGTNGKTTTTTLCGEMLRAAGITSAVCGNIGTPLSAVVDDLSTDAVAVVEVSSYQLHSIDSFRPRVSVTTNLQPDHLDWHGSLEAYYEAKRRVAENQSAGDAFVYNSDDPAIDLGQVPTGVRRLGFSIVPHGIVPHGEGAAAFVQDGWLCVRRRSEESDALDRVTPLAEIRLRGRHNLANAAAAALAVGWLGVPHAAIAEALRLFAGVEHRLEPTGEVGGVSFVNDSKATNVDSVCVALEAMDRPIRLIMGGRDKGAPYEPVSRAARGKVRQYFLIGEAADEIERQLAAADEIERHLEAADEIERKRAASDEVERHIEDAAPGTPAISRAATMDDAVQLAWESAEPGDVVLLSPACSSFDMFVDFEDRGRAFKNAVAKLQAE